jgi:uncharacterized membrane protein YuzA (DUF378 family)
MLCPKCDMEIPSDSISCRNCGSLVKSPSITTTSHHDALSRDELYASATTTTSVAWMRPPSSAAAQVLRAVSWVIIVVGAILGIVIWQMFGALDTLLGSLVGPALAIFVFAVCGGSGAFFLVFADIADDIASIHHNLAKR